MQVNDHVFGSVADDDNEAPLFLLYPRNISTLLVTGKLHGMYLYAIPNERRYARISD